MSAVAFLGPEGTFASEAARRAAPDAQRQPAVTIEDVFAAVRDGAADIGVVPVENSIEGSVNLTLDELAFGRRGVFIRGEVLLPVSMNLLAPPGVGLGDLVCVRSQPVALAQSRKWLAANLPGVRIEAATSTAEAARVAAEAPDAEGPAGALGPRYAADRYGLAVLAADVQDHSGNATRFLVLGRDLAPPTGADKTSMVVFFGEDRPGLLLRILDEFALRGINLSKIESRPTKQQLGEYCIFIDAAGHLTEPRVGAALRSVHRHVAELRILGSFPRGDEVQDIPAPQDSAEAYEAARRWYRDLLEHMG
jgi:prephenate dehydratase